MGTGDLNYLQVGGIYSEVSSAPGYERHHIPSNAVQDEDGGNFPIILIRVSDHKLTDSFRGKQQHKYQSFFPDINRSDSNRNEIASEIDLGNYIDVVRWELYNIID